MNRHPIDRARTLSGSGDLDRTGGVILAPLSSHGKRAALSGELSVHLLLSRSASVDAGWTSENGTRDSPEAMAVLPGALVLRCASLDCSFSSSMAWSRPIVSGRQVVFSAFRLGIPALPLSATNVVPIHLAPRRIVFYC